jgi:hypothetical protein
MTGTCASCSRTTVINVHHGLCHACVLRASRLATTQGPPGNWKGPAELLRVALVMWRARRTDQFQEDDFAHTVSSRRDRTGEAPISTVYACVDRDGGPEWPA